LTPRILVAHLKQSAARCCGMPASLGTLLCASWGSAIPRKEFYHRQGINRPSGVMCVRPLVGLLAPFVAAILLCASTHADPQSQPSPMIGLFYLENSDAAGNPPYNWAKDGGIPNPNLQGIAMRTQWNRVEPHEHTNPNDFYWDYLDQGLAAAAAVG